MNNGKKITWVKWDHVVTSFKNGGINVGSLSLMNHALLGKWWGRSLTEESSFWVSIIKNLYGEDGGLFSTVRRGFINVGKDNRLKESPNLKLPGSFRKKSRKW